MSKIFAPKKSHLIEETAARLAAEYWEIGKSQGLDSKCKTAREFGKKNLEKFIPITISLFIDMLANPTFPQYEKDRILEALMERHNDPTLQTPTQLPNIDVKKLIALTETTKGTKATQDNLAVIKTIEQAVKSVNKDYVKQLKMN